MDERDRRGAQLLADIMARAGMSDVEIVTAVRFAYAYGVLGCMLDDEPRPRGLPVPRPREPARLRTAKQSAVLLSAQEALRTKREKVNAERFEMLSTVLDARTTGAAAKRLGLGRNAVVSVLLSAGYRNWADYQARYPLVHKPAVIPAGVFESGDKIQVHHGNGATTVQVVKPELPEEQAIAPERCEGCGYFTGSVGHKVECCG